MARERKTFKSRKSRAGVTIWQGQLWDLLEKGQRNPPRVDLCTDDEVCYVHGEKGKRKRSERQKIAYLTKLYTEKLHELTKEKEKAALVEKAKPSSPMILEIMQKWLDHVSVFRSTTTAGIYLESVNHYINTLGDHPIAEFEHDFNTRLLLYLQKMPNKKGGFYSTANQIRHLKAIQTFFNWAYKRDYLERPIKLDKPQAEKKDPNIFTLEDLQRLESYILKRLREEPNKRHSRNLKNHHRLLKMAMATVLRRGAIWALKLDHINLEKRIIKIRNNDELKWKNKKNKQVDKPISNDLLAYLKEDLANRDSQERYYLDNGHGQPCYKNPAALSKSFGRHCRELGLDNIKPLHGIRATMITELIRQGVDISLVKDLADHESIITTESYINSKQISAKNLVEQIPRLISSIDPQQENSN